MDYWACWDFGELILLAVGKLAYSFPVELGKSVGVEEFVVIPFGRLCYLM